ISTDVALSGTSLDEMTIDIVTVSFLAGAGSFLFSFLELPPVLAFVVELLFVFSFELLVDLLVLLFFSELFDDGLLDCFAGDFSFELLAADDFVDSLFSALADAFVLVSFFVEVLLPSLLAKLFALSESLPVEDLS